MRYLEKFAASDSWINSDSYLGPKRSAGPKKIKESAPLKEVFHGSGAPRDGFPSVVPDASKSSKPLKEVFHGTGAPMDKFPSVVPEGSKPAYSGSTPGASTPPGGPTPAKLKLNPWVKGGLIGAGVVGTAAIVSSLTSKPSRVW